MIGEMIGNIQKNKLIQYEKVVKSFKKLFDQKEIGELIYRKADIELSIRRKKANFNRYMNSSFSFFEAR
jgi:hypothetical protein